MGAYNHFDEADKATATVTGPTIPGVVDGRMASSLPYRKLAGIESSWLSRGAASNGSGRRPTSSRSVTASW